MSSLPTPGHDDQPVVPVVSTVRFTARWERWVGTLAWSGFLLVSLSMLTVRPLHILQYLGITTAVLAMGTLTVRAVRTAVVIDDGVLFYRGLFRTRRISLASVNHAEVEDRD
jgi:hypothetical protein